ncbi:hypothetical protein B0F90DRAFT_1669835 [Multifurca ochricompacta]|uniref:Uncharacterized protein n=1 Tax=Multifurca ochricompacta TaxID=376703 RepID=A0AAD4LZ95_9AGAM|nr:hypothetical protein B0F90DRAFT_1669835 [Multifurca ochricompacta]
MGISLPKAELISLGLTTFLYGWTYVLLFLLLSADRHEPPWIGLFFTLFCITMVVMLFRVTDDIRNQRAKILLVSFLMLLVATLHLIVVWVRGVEGFIMQKSGSAQAFYEDIADTTSVLKISCLLCQSLLGDGVMVWRTYIVFGKRIYVVLPVILLIAAYTAVGSVALSFIAKARPGTDVFHVATSWITAYFSLTMSTNVLCSGAIAWRIFLSGKFLRNTRTLGPVIFVIVESSALYALGVIAVLATFLSGSNGQYPAVDAIVPLVGIVFSLIVLQIRFHVSASAGPRSDGQVSINGGGGGVWPPPSRQQPSRLAGGNDLEYPMRSIRMAVHISKQTHTHVASDDEMGAGRDSSSDIDKLSPL